MLRDNPVDSSHRCLENPRPTGAEPSLTEDVTSPFQAEPRHKDPESPEEALTLLQNTFFSFSMKVCGQRQDAEAFEMWPGL